MSRANIKSFRRRLSYNERMVALCVAKILTIEEPCLTAARRHWEKKLEIHKSQHNKLRNKLEQAENKRRK